MNVCVCVCLSGKYVMFFSCSYVIQDKWYGSTFVWHIFLSTDSDQIHFITWIKYSRYLSRIILVSFTRLFWFFHQYFAICDYLNSKWGFVLLDYAKSDWLVSVANDVYVWISVCDMAVMAFEIRVNWSSLNITLILALCTYSKSNLQTYT